RLFAAALDLDKLPVACHDEIQIDLGVLVFGIVQVEQLDVAAQAHADRRDAATHDAGSCAQDVLVGRQRIHQGNVCSVDGGRARAAVGLQNIAVDPERAFGQLCQVHHGTEAAADEALDLDAAAVDLAAPVARLAAAGAAGQHAVFCG